MRSGGPAAKTAKRFDTMEATKDFPIAIGPPGTTLTYSPTNHDLFTSPDQVVLREVRNGQFGPALHWR